MTATERIITKFDNNPPDDDQILAEKLATDHAEDVERYNNIVLLEKNLPADIVSDEDQGKYSDYLKKVSSMWKIFDANRKSENEPHAAKVRVINSFFKSKNDVLETIEERAKSIMTKYSKAKEDEKRRAAELKAEQEREEAARKQKEAEEKQRAAEEAARKAADESARLVREAEAARLKAAADAEAARKKAEAEAQAIRDKAAADKAAAEKEIQALKDAAAARDKADATEKERIANERLAAELKLRDAAAAQKEAERTAKEIVKTAEKEIKADERDLKADEKAAEAQISALAKDAKTAEREGRYAAEDAEKADKSAMKLERVAEGKSADFTRTRGISSMSSTSDYKTGHLVDLDTLDIEKLRYHVPLDAWDKAIKSAVRAGQSEIKGAAIYVETRLNNR